VAVISSPFGKPSGGNQPIPPRPKPPEQSDVQRKAKEFLELGKSTDSAIQRVREQPNERLSQQEKQYIIAEIERLAETGRSKGSLPEFDRFSKAKSLGKALATGVIAPFTPKNNQVTDTIVKLYQGVQRVGQSAAKEIVDLRTSRGLKAFLPAGGYTPVVGSPVKPVGGVSSLGELAQRVSPMATPEEAKRVREVYKREGDTQRGSLKDFLNQVADPEWKYKTSAANKAVVEGNPITGFLTELAVNTVADPATWVTGIGNVKYIGRAGKLSLAQRLSTQKMIEKYPQLADKFNDIVRFGQNAPIEGFKDILKAEGIETGIRVAGQLVKGSERISTPVGQALSGSWEKIMDIATGVRNSGLVMSPSSRAFMMDVGRRTKGAYRLAEPKALENVARWSARQFAKGVTPYQLNRFVSQIRDTVSQARTEGIADDLSDLAERANPYSFTGKPVFDALPENQQRLVQQYVDWQNNVYAETEAVYKKFGTDFGTDVPDFSWIENYVFHKVSKEASEWIAANGGSNSRFAKFFDSGQLDVADITDMAAPLRYRKYRAPQVMPDGTVKYEQFMGVDVKEGTIKELNEIFKRQTGADINFFETDIGTIAESYAYSMAKMRGREAYVRRLMDYGDVAAAPLLRNTIPDPVLRAAAAKELEEATAIRNTVRSRLGRRMTDLKSVLKRGVKDAEDVVNGNVRQRATNQRETDATIKRIETLQDNLVKLRQQADELGVDKRGEFDVVHAALLTNLQNLKVSLQNGTAELDDIRLGLQTTYQSMYPNKTNIPEDIEVLADRILAAKGVPASREARAINSQMRDLRAQLDALSPTSEEYAELSAEIDRLKDLDNGFRVASEYRAAQDYAPDNGFLFISGREMAETDEMQIGLKLLRTSANGLPDPNDVMAVRVFGNDEIIDTRATGGVARTFGVFDFGDGLADQLDVLGINATPLKDGLDAVRVGLPVDPELEQAYPEIADLIKLMEGNQSREILPYGDPQLIKAIYEEFVDTTTALLMRVGIDNPDLVARNMVDSAIGWVADVGVETNSARGVLLPAILFDDAAELDDVVVALAPRVALRATDSVTGSVQDASSPLVQAIMRTDAESAANASRARLNELSARQAEINDTGTAIREQLTKLGRRKAGLKGAATKRRNAAALAKERAGTARNAPREVIIDGKPEQLTLAQINKRFEKLTATEQRLRTNMERTLKTEQAALKEGGVTMRGAEAKLAANTDRLRVMMDEALALHAWDTGTGMMVRDDIAAGIDLIGSMPPAGVGGEATRNWLASVQRGVNSSSLISDPSIRTAYERLHQLVAFDEWNLSLADEAVAISARELDDLDTGKFGGILDAVDKRVLEGWEAIDGLGVQVPSEVLDIWRPNLAKILVKKERGKLMQGLDYLNKVFKTYAIGTPGFVIRNLYSAMFTNGVAGVDAQTMLDGYKAAHYYNKFGAGRWLDELGVTGVEREQYEQAMLAVEASGRRGFFSDLSEPVVGGTRRERVANAILNNKYTKAIRGSNTRVEDAVRFPLALKAVRQGDDYVGAAQQVTRYHFDYTDLSQVDEFALKFVPFWIWTTRNLPNQLANQWMRPQVYSLWENLSESLPADDNVLMPSWMKDYEPLGFTRFGLSPTILLRPDLPHQRLERTIRDLTSERIIGQLYPTYKVPLEGVARRNIALDIPFRDTPREAVGIDKYLAQALNALGAKGAAPKVRDETGKETQMITDYPSYALGNFIPLIATLQRITGGKLGGKQSYADRQPSAIASFLGLPVDYVSEKMQGSEAVGRQFNISDYLGELQRLGLVESKEITTKRKGDLRKANEEAIKAAKNKLIQDVSRQMLQAKEKFGIKSPQYKELKQRLSDLKSPSRAQKRIDEENIIALYGKDSLEHRRWLEEQNLIKGKP
jgi:hypothetical protein